MNLWDIINRIFGILVAFLCVKYFISTTRQRMLRTGKNFWGSVDGITATLYFLMFVFGIMAAVDEIPLIEALLGLGRGGRQ